VPLDEGLKRLELGTLPERSVVITFDDGFHDFYSRAWPLLSKFAMPATVYWTTYYSEFSRPVFGLISSYLLWKRRDSVLQNLPIGHWKGPLELRTERNRDRIVSTLQCHSLENHLSAATRDDLCAKLSEQLGIDYEALKARRILQIMSREEVREIANSGGVSVQLHTHRHAMPRDWVRFRNEIDTNRTRIEELTGRSAIHLAYLAACAVLSTLIG
jgi:peptidoglycan/xylan/chitin deacetylase (PgdA/CDA1 family)